jgi:5'-3' exonuclease
MDKVLHKASHLEPRYISKAITLVDNELKKQLEHDEKQNLPELHAFLIKVQQSESDYFAMLKTEERERDELTSKHDKQRQEEHKKIEMINDAIELLRDQIEDFKDVKTELKQKRQAAGLQREEECEQLRKRQRGD